MGALSAVILDSLYPRTQIRVTAQVLENRSSSLCAIINAACLALMDASVPLRSMVAATSCGVRDDGDGNYELVAGPTHAGDRAQFTHCFDDTLKGPVVSHCTGQFHSEELFKGIRVCSENCSKVFTFMREQVTAK